MQPIQDLVSGYYNVPLIFKMKHYYMYLKKKQLD